MKIRKKNFSLEIENGAISCTWNIPRGLKGRYFWLYFSNEKHNKAVWGDNECEHKYNFCLSIPNVITIDTAYTGKRIFNTRLFLTTLFKKDYKIYSSGNDAQSSC